MFELIATPFGYLMNWLHQWTGSYVLALLLFTLTTKLVLLPLSIRQQKNSVRQAQIRPKERAIRRRYEGRADQQARMDMATDLQRMYQEEHYSLAGGCLPQIIQLLLILSLFQIVHTPEKYVATPNMMLFGINLGQAPTANFFSWLLVFPLLATAFQWLSTLVMQKLMPPPQADSPENASAAKTVNTMNIVMLAMTLFFGITWPAILSLYWVYQSIFDMIIRIVLNKIFPIPQFTEEEYLAVEAEVNRDFVPTPVSSGARSLHRVDDEESESTPASSATHRPESAPRVRVDKNGKPIRSLHYIDFDEEDEQEPPKNS